MICRVFIFSFTVTFSHAYFRQPCYDLTSHQNVDLLPKAPRCGPAEFTKVMDGEDAREGEFPWIVTLHNYNQGRKFKFCDGTIITRRHVLIAAHCLHGYVNEYYKDRRYRLHNLFVGMGQQDYTESYTEIFVLDIQTHPQYDTVTHVNDVGLILLETYIEFDLANSIYPVCLPITCDVMTKDLSNQHLILAGWGMLQENPYPVEASALQKATVRVVPNADCQKSWRYWQPIHDKQMCTIGEGGRGESVCRGDSGGPLVVKLDYSMYVVGIVSMAAQCSASYPSPLPNILARVSAYSKWILDSLLDFNYYRKYVNGKPN